MLNANWQAFLEQQGAHPQDGIVQDFGDASTERIATRDGTVLCDLSQFGMLKVSGDDAQSFLQNLLSNDIKAVTPQLAQLSSFNTAKGRVVATFLIWQNGSDYFLQLPATLIAPMQKKLSMYVLRAKVKIEDVSAQHICLGFSGKESAALLQTSIGEPPQTPLAMAHHAGVSVMRTGDERFQLITSAGHAPALWNKLCPQARPVGSSCWDWLNIRAGIPVVLPATQEQFVLQMLNLDIIGGVSFKKGCYPGQEIVARMHYLGKLKQRTFLAHVDSDVAPQPNDALYSDDYTGQTSGSILNVAPAPQGGYDVLATLHTGTVNDARIVHWQSPDGATLDFQPLPYPFPAESGG
ncbi:MAG: folate-binding protein [Gallionellaceae bacterium]|nr:MAG: folate-binding protein [Gallionellaceae bacterium]